MIDLHLSSYLTLLSRQQYRCGPYTYQYTEILENSNRFLQKIQKFLRKRGRQYETGAPFPLVGDIMAWKMRKDQTKMPPMQVCMTPIMTIMVLVTMEPSQTLPVALKKYRLR